MPDDRPGPAAGQALPLCSDANPPLDSHTVAGPSPDRPGTPISGQSSRPPRRRSTRLAATNAATPAHRKPVSSARRQLASSTSWRPVRHLDAASCSATQSPETGQPTQTESGAVQPHRARKLVSHTQSPAPLSHIQSPAAGEPRRAPVVGNGGRGSAVAAVLGWPVSCGSGDGLRRPEIFLQGFLLC